MARAKAFLPLGSPLGRASAALLLPGLAGFVLLPAAAPAQQFPLESGVWVDESGSGAVEVYQCAERADRLCGRIIWLKEPLNKQGLPKRDRYNPKESLQTRPICGLPVLGNLARVPEGGYDGGWIYDPRAGKSYSAAIQRTKSDRLLVTGYVGVKFLSKSFTWTRAPLDLLRCEGAPPAAQEAKATGPAATRAPVTAATTPAPTESNPAPKAAAAPSPPTHKAASATSTTTSPSAETLSVPKPVAAKRPASKPSVAATAAAPPVSAPSAAKKTTAKTMGGNAESPNGTHVEEASNTEAEAPNPKATAPLPQRKPATITGFSWETAQP